MSEHSRNNFKYIKIKNVVKKKEKSKKKKYIFYLLSYASSRNN